MVISSPVFENNTKIPLDYSCDGPGINPPLLFLDVPEITQSLALIVEDPDAPSGTFIHWVVYNIDPKTEEVTEGSVPKGGIEGLNTAGEAKFRPPCPPNGEHRYIFKLYALDTTLDLPEGSTKEEIEESIKGHIIDTAELTGLYNRT
ncbi:YbhB/YbcL family Raf kinase inhibitor-like protein [Candidatus Parcubacteria bacterium]|nr:MAG: YbhB/YbcL family Raf kinase inhibitor-like protein [Candidatus Parcubacteria bacterium]